MAIDINWLGHSCFRIKAKAAVLLTDPYDESIGYAPSSVRADIVTSSHAHPGHSHVSGVDGQPRVIRGPGEYEVSGVFITGMPSFHDAEGGAERGKNTIYVIEMEDTRLCHLGDLGHNLSTDQVEQIGSVDVLMVPVGGFSTIDAAAAAEIVRLLQPKLILPMHFKTDVLRFQLDPVDRFLKEMGVKADLMAEPKLSISRGGMPEESQVVVLDHKASI